ncbi:MAG: hypothetical protein V1846_00770 [Candidatus Komeilibacteria bacterium]
MAELPTSAGACTSAGAATSHEASGNFHNKPDQWYGEKGKKPHDLPFFGGKGTIDSERLSGSYQLLFRRTS